MLTAFFPFHLCFQIFLHTNRIIATDTDVQQGVTIHRTVVLQTSDLDVQRILNKYRPSFGALMTVMLFIKKTASVMCRSFTG